MFQAGRPGRNHGQALVEVIVVMPVLLLLLLAAADMGKFFVISGKSEIAARYIALRHFREAPFGDAYPTYTATQEIEGLFFNDALNDEEDDEDVAYEELGDDDLLYAPGDLGNPFLAWLWDYVNRTDDLFPIRGDRSTFTYNLPAFPYGRESPVEGTRDLPGTPSPGTLAAGYDATGNFVMLADSFSGQHGEDLRVAMEAAGLIVGAQLSAPLMVGLLGVLWIIFI